MDGLGDGGGGSGFIRGHEGEVDDFGAFCAKRVELGAVVGGDELFVEPEGGGGARVGGWRAGGTGLRH